MDTDLEKLWSDIQEEISNEGLTLSNVKLLSSGVQTPWGEVLVGIDWKGRRHVVVPAPNDVEEEQANPSRGISVEVRPYFVGNKESLYCDISCRLEALNQMFSSVAADIVASLRQSNAESPYPICLQVLERWRKLLERPPTKLLSRTAQAGLLGELIFLRQVIDQAPEAIRSWVGPKGGRHDFVSPNVDVEVKTSLRAERRVVSVQSLAQLDSSEPARLYLKFFALREPVGQGVSVPDLIEEILAHGVNSVELYEQLSELGYSPADRRSYRQVRFELVEELLFRVDRPGFPRLTPASLKGSIPKGVLNLSYDIDLDVAGSSPVEDAEDDEVLREMRQT